MFPSEAGRGHREASLTALSGNRDSRGPENVRPLSENENWRDFL